MYYNASCVTFQYPATCGIQQRTILQCVVHFNVLSRYVSENFVENHTVGGL